MREEPTRIAADLLTGFPRALREAGLAIDPMRTRTFLAAVAACRLAGLRDLQGIGRITLTSSHDDFPLFDDVFDAWFGEATFAGRVEKPEEDNAPRPRPPGGREPVPLDLFDGEAAGSAAADDHLRNRKTFSRAGPAEHDALARLKRRLTFLPRTRSRSLVAAATGRRIDLPRTARAARRTFGETLRILRRERPEKPRRLLLLIDVSGSMKAQSEIYLRFAHLVTRRHPKVETFCFGTRLSRVTGKLRHREPEQALARLSGIVFDFDGGTAIGASLEAFLSVSRYASLVRGAVTLIFSDGLERGEPGPMVHAVSRLALLSHRLVWISPLAADPRYRPATRGMAGVLPHLDALLDGGSLAALEHMVEKLETIEHEPRGQAGRRFTAGRKAA